MSNSKKRKKKLNLPVFIIGIICILAAGGMAVHNVWTIHKSNVAIEEMKDGMEEAMAAAMAERAAQRAAEEAANAEPEIGKTEETDISPEAVPATAPEETVETPSEPSETKVPSQSGGSSSGTSSGTSSPAVTATPAPTKEPVRLDSKLDMPTWSWKEFEYIGFLDIPALGLHLPIMSTYSSYLMAIAPCRYQGSVARGNLVIAGHNYSNHFGNLSKLAAGSTITFTDADGVVYNYSVTKTEYIKPSNTEAMITGDWDLTVFTCNTYGTQRIAVRCSLS